MFKTITLAIALTVMAARYGGFLLRIQSCDENNIYRNCHWIDARDPSGDLIVRPTYYSCADARKLWYPNLTRDQWKCERVYLNHG